MASIVVNKELFVDLVNFKLLHLNTAIQNILAQWKYSSVDQFLADARDGTLKEAEMDAIGLRQLIKKRDELLKVKDSGLSTQCQEK